MTEVANLLTIPRRNTTKAHNRKYGKAGEKQKMPDSMICPNCLKGSVETFYTADPVPIHSVTLVPSQQAALTFPKGRVALAFCRSCGFVTNTSFDATRMNYSPLCEETQGFSDTFRSFQLQLAKDVIEKCSLHRKTVLEIGCGKGEFITVLCALSGGRGIGFDPAYEPTRRPTKDGEPIEFFQDTYSEKYAHIQADCIVCKMTLEHIPNTLSFLRMIRNAIGRRMKTALFFQVPNLSRVLEGIAFWDVYHEHCSYFTIGSLQNLFRLAGFEVRCVWRGYDDQYLMVIAYPLPHLLQWRGGPEAPSDVDQDAVRRFSIESNKRVQLWQESIQRFRVRRQKVVIWGSGSKGVSFLSAVDASAQTGPIEYAVDVNPYRNGFYMPGTGQKIVAPSYLAGYRPDVVIIMNAVYRNEIDSELRRLGVKTTLLSVDEAPDHGCTGQAS